MRAFELEEKIDPELYQQLRRHAGVALSSVALFGILLTASGNEAAAYVGLFVFVLCGLVAGAITFLAKWRGSSVKQLYPNATVLAYEFDPHPINSLVKALRKHIPISSLALIQMMSSDISESDEYYHNEREEEKSLVQIIKEECPDAAVVVYGPAGSNKVSREGNQFRYVETEGALTKHVNLLVTKDNRAFVWHEPYHVIRNKKHIFTGGAYLIAIDDDLRRKVEDEFASLRKVTH